MNILYLINQYPKASHTFIRREIHALEKDGCKVFRVATRHDPVDSMSEIDSLEHKKTYYVLAQSKCALVIDFLKAFLLNSTRFYSCVSSLLDMNKQSKQSILKHIIYLVEATHIARHCKLHSVKHIHAHFGTNPAEVAMYSSILTGIPYSFTVHGPEEFDKPLTLNLNLKIKNSKSVIAITSFCRSQLFRWADYSDWKKIKIIHCALEKDFFSNNHTNIQRTDSPIFLCIGRICEQKGQLLLVQAFNDYLKKGHKGKLIFAGDGEMRSEVESLIDAWGIVDLVQITGWVDSIKIKELLINSSVMVLPSFAEGLPVALMEAMASRTPVISTSIAGIPELVIDGKTGFLITPGDVNSICDALCKYNSCSIEMLNQITDNAYEVVLENHNADKEAVKLLEVFRS